MAMDEADRDLIEAVYAAFAERDVEGIYTGFACGCRFALCHRKTLGDRE